MHRAAVDRSTAPFRCISRSIDVVAFQRISGRLPLQESTCEPSDVLETRLRQLPIPDDARVAIRIGAVHDNLIPGIQEALGLLKIRDVHGPGDPLGPEREFAEHVDERDLVTALNFLLEFLTTNQVRLKFLLAFNCLGCGMSLLSLFLDSLRGRLE